MRINIVFPAKLGDGLTLTPLLKLLKNNGYKINLFCSEYNQIIFKGNPHLENLISLPRNIFKNHRFPVLPKILSLINLFLYFLGNKNIKIYKNLPTFVINTNIQSYVFGYLLSNNVFYMNPVYNFLGGKHIKIKKDQLFSFQILHFFNKALNKKLNNMSMSDFNYQLFWGNIKFDTLTNKIDKKIRKDFVRYNLSATLKQKELTIEENINKIENILIEGCQVLLTDYDINTDNIIKIKMVFGNKLYYLTKKMSLLEIYNLSTYCKKYYGPDSGISHLISTKCNDCNIFFTRNNRVEIVWLPLQNSKPITI